MGNTPSDVQITEGEHMVVVKKAGFKDWERKLKSYRWKQRASECRLGKNSESELKRLAALGGTAEGGRPHMSFWTNEKREHDVLPFIS